jgi:hypothetical protein
VRRRARAVLLGAALLCAALPAAAQGAEILSCRGRTLAYAADYSRLIETVEPVSFVLELDLERGGFSGAPVRDASGFELRAGTDAVFFHRRARIAGKSALEWISVSRVSGAYAHFIAPRDEATGALGVPLLLGAADCRAMPR